ncbi:MAG: TonB-dependent receptor [Myxococcota bacterium]
MAAALCGSAARAEVPPSTWVEAPRRALEPANTVVPLTEVLPVDVMRNRGARDLSEALATIPGVQVVELRDGRRLLVLDGLLARALVAVDGRPVTPGPQGEVDLSELPGTLDEVERVELIRQPMSHVYGSGADGGVINIVTRRVDGTGVSATVLGVAQQRGRADARASAHGSFEGARGGAYLRLASLGVVSSPWSPPSPDAPLRHGAALGVGGAFHLHRRVLVRGDADLREAHVETGVLDRRRRAQLATEAIVALWEQDTLRVQLRSGGVGSQVGFTSVSDRWAGVEQGASIRYLGEPISTHGVHLELTALGEWVMDGGVGAAQRLRVSGLIADTWRVGERFSLEGALRLESSEVLQPAAAPSLSLRYEPFEHVVVRGGVAAGYRYAGLVDDASLATLPTWALPATGTQAESSRSMRLSALFAPSDVMRAAVVLFRTELTDRAPDLKTEAFGTGVAAPPGSGKITAHVQGLRTELAMARLKGGFSVRGGYVYLDQARDDRRDVPLPLAPTHSGVLVVGWQHARWGSGAEVGGEAAVDRPRMDGTGWRPQVQLHVSFWQQLGPFQAALVAHNTTGVRDVELGPREGRSVRALLRAEY